MNEKRVNYSKQFKKQNDAEIVEPQVEEVVNEAVETEEPVKEVVAKPASKTVYGVVTGCSKLRIRKSASVSAPVLLEINAGTKVAIDKRQSHKDWYKVCTEDGADGFCMKQFITLE